MESSIGSSNGQASGQIEPPFVDPHEQDYGILVFSHLRWNFVWQRPQQFISRFAAIHPVLFVEEPIYDLRPGEDSLALVDSVAPNVQTVVVHFSSNLRGQDVGARMALLVRQAIDQTDEVGAFEKPLLWYYSPMMAAWSLDRFSHRAVVYDCMDELSLFAGAPPEMAQEEARLLKMVDVVFTGGHELWQAKRRQHKSAHFFGCGVEYEHFAQAQDSSIPLPLDMYRLSRPIVGWFGVIDERMDYELLEQAAMLRPNWTFVLVGPVAKVDPRSLPKLPNLLWLGRRDYEVLPDYGRAFDVCMMPFALNDATRFINPTKALEYLATGKPVVSTPVKDVVKQYSDLIAIASTPSEFVANIELALRDTRREKSLRGIEKAARSSWEGTVSQMQGLISAAIRQRAERKHAYMS